MLASGLLQFYNYIVLLRLQSISFDCRMRDCIGRGSFISHNPDKTIFCFIGFYVFLALLM